MPVAVRKVTNRRKLHFSSTAELLAEAEALAAADAQGRVTPLGNMSLGVALGHLALWLHASIDGVPMDAPLWLKLPARLLKGYVLSHTLLPGYKLPPKAAEKLIPPESITAAEGLAQLKAAAVRVASTDQRVPSPMLGKLSVADWERLQLRHAEQHLSFMQVAGG
jgi:hypothetical protein